MHFTVGKISSTRGRIACRKTPSRTKLLATGACFHRYRSGTGMNAKRSMYASTIQPRASSAPCGQQVAPTHQCTNRGPLASPLSFTSTRWIAFSRFDNKPLGASCLVNLVIVEGQPQSCNLIPPPITSRCWQFNHLHVVKVIFDEFGDGHVKFFAEGIGFEQVA